MVISRFHLLLMTHLFSLYNPYLSMINYRVREDTIILNACRTEINDVTKVLNDRFIIIPRVGKS